MVFKFSNKGFTTVELVVIVAIIGFMSAAVISGQSQGLSERRLILEARRLTQDLRKSQNFTVSSISQDCGVLGTKVVPFGIILDMDQLDRYILAADCDWDKIYDAGSDPIISSFVFSHSRISNLSPKNSGNALEVFFFPPNPSVAVNTDESGSANATITLCSVRNSSYCRNIYVNSRGAVSAQ